MNEQVKIYICTHTDFERPVHHPVYEIIDARDINGDYAENGLRGSFYSELMTYKYLADHRELPDYVGFCGYRKYFGFMDDVPDVASIIRERGCIATERERFRMTVYEQYAYYHARQDMDLLREVIWKMEEEAETGLLPKRRDYAPHPTMGAALDRMLLGYEMHTCNMFIMYREDFLEMMQIVWELLDGYIAKAGNIEERINSHPDWYLRRTGRGGRFWHQYRIGGFLGERLASAYIMEHFPDAQTCPMIVTGKPKRQNT